MPARVIHADSQSSEEIELFRYSRCDLVKFARSWSERVARVKTDTWAKKGGGMSSSSNAGNFVKLCSIDDSVGVMFAD